MAKYPKGRAQRGKVVGEIANAYKNKKTQTIEELAAKTGRTPTTIGKAITEMIENGSVIRKIKKDWPPKQEFEFVEGLSDSDISAMETQFHQQYQSVPYLSPIDQVKLESEKKRLADLKQQIDQLKNIKLRPIHPSAIEALKKEYYRNLSEANQDLSNTVMRRFKDSVPEEWEKCGNCVNCKIIQDTSTRKNKCKCTLEWRVKGARKEHNLDDTCDDFKMKMPKS